MTYNKDPRTDTDAKHDKSIFILSMNFIVELDRIFIKKYGLSFFKGNTVFPLIGFVLPRIPFKSNHTYYIFTLFVYVNQAMKANRKVEGLQYPCISSLTFIDFKQNNEWRLKASINKLDSNITNTGRKKWIFEKSWIGTFTIEDSDIPLMK